MVNAKTWNSAQIDQAIRRLEGIIRSGSYNPAELNQLLNQLGEPGYINTWNPAELDQKLRTLLHDLLSWKTATGNPIQLRTNNGGLVQSCEVTMLPIQDLHGYDYPWVGGAGKNKLNMVDVLPSGSYNGDTFECSSLSNRPTVTLFSEPTSIIFSFKKATFVGSNGRIEFYNGSTLFSSKTLTGENQSDIIQNVTAIKFNYSNGSELSVEEPMIRLATVTDATYAPYSNICPISGRDDLHLYVDTEQTETPEKTYTATFSDTVYGGNHEFVSGKLTSEWGYIAEYDGETITEPWISSIDKYVAGTTPSTGAEVCYKLATPTEITLTPEEIELLTGYNVLWTDGDSIEITYKKLLLPSDAESLSKNKKIKEKPKTTRSKKKKEE